MARHLCGGTGADVVIDPEGNVLRGDVGTAWADIDKITQITDFQDLTGQSISGPVTDTHGRVLVYSPDDDSFDGFWADYGFGMFWVSRLDTVQRVRALEATLAADEAGALAAWTKDQSDSRYARTVNGGAPDPTTGDVVVATGVPEIACPGGVQPLRSSVTSVTTKPVTWASPINHPPSNATGYALEGDYWKKLPAV